MPLPFHFDFRNPDYNEVLQWRMENLKKLRKNPELIKMLRLHYKNNIVDFINDWGMTFDPRNLEIGRPAGVPFVLFPKQEDCVHWIVDRWRKGEPGIIEKSRDCGMSWLLVAIFCSMGILYEDINFGLGSRHSDYVDKKGSPKALFEKARKFISLLPKELRAGWSEKRDAPFMLIRFPDTSSTIAGECGDNIGRGDRTAVYGIDESAHIEHPLILDAALSATTNCRIDLSTPLGMANSFAQRRHSGRIPVFTFHWTDDPRKDIDWYNKKVYELNNPVIVAQELDLNYAASISGVIIPPEWVEASVDAHIKLGIQPTGIRCGGFDVADEGKDKCAYAGRHGIVVNFLEEWTGKGADIFDSVQQVFTMCDIEEHESFDYDADGLGSGCKGDSRVLNEARGVKGSRQIVVRSYHGSGGVYDPDGEMVKERKNSDFFLNLKAQAWWHLRLKFQATYRAVVEGMAFDPEDIISLSSMMPLLNKLKIELSQPVYGLNNNGKMIVDKQPEGMKSPNLADSIVILFNPARQQTHRFDGWSD